MNYRHSFHAGNFADLVKHALVLWLLEQRRAVGPVAVFDTHAGAGLYDLTGDAARSKEAEAGILRLMAAAQRPPLIQALADRVAAVNTDEAVRFYPGSPVLIAGAMGADDRYLGFELKVEVKALLDEALAPYPHAGAQAGDGYDALIPALKGAGASLVLIDPPFEQADDYWRAADTAAAASKAGAMVAVWTPLKDMETFDAFLRRLAAAGAGSALVAEARMRPLTNPMKMNGCAMVMLGAPDGTDAAAEQVCGWVVQTLGEAGARAEVWRA